MVATEKNNLFVNHFSDNVESSNSLPPDCESHCGV